MTQTVLKTQVTELSADSGLQKEGRQLIATELNKAVADTYRLLANTQGVHWNVQGPLFYSLHKLTESQYEDMFASVDELAERARSLGFPAPQNFGTLERLSSIDDVDPDGDLNTQIEQLIAGNEKLASALRKLVTSAERVEDVKTADLATERVGVHEENAWMLRATIAS